MSNIVTPKKKSNPPQPADLIRDWSRWLRNFEPMAELDFSWPKQAITICDMRVPNALRYGILYTVAEVANEAYSDADRERRVKAFMGLP